MPELPEAETTVRKLKPLILGKRILDFNKKVLGIERRGKAILIFLGRRTSDRTPDVYVLGFHQRMSGRLLIVPRGFKDKYIRRRFKLSGGKDLVLHDVRKFGVVWCGPAKKVFEDNYFTTLGEDALTISRRNFINIFKNRGGKIKPFLLNQKNIAGIGNIMADEILWRAKIHPETATSELGNNKIKILWSSLRAVLKRSIKMGGSTMRDWLHPGGERGGYFEKRFVYDREGRKCFRCGRKILRKKISGRSAYYCPVCQKL